MRKKHKAIRVFVTEGCNANCNNCFNHSIRTKKELSTSEFEALCVYLTNSGFTSLKMMGGEPTYHSNFEKIYRIAQDNFKNVALFTNALNDKIINLNPRGKDCIIYNMNFSDMLTQEKVLSEKQGKRTMKFQITPETDVVRTVDSILFWRRIDARLKPSFTFDCTTNIFDEKKVLISKIVAFEKKLDELDIPYGFDHRVPLCFLLGCKDKMSYPGGSCRAETAGLIDAGLNLRYCNQHHDVIVRMLNENNEYIDWEIIKNHLLKYYYQQQIRILNGECINCKLFGDFCNGGCWGEKNSLSVTPQ